MLTDEKTEVELDVVKTTFTPTAASLEMAVSDEVEEAVIVQVLPEESEAQSDICRGSRGCRFLLPTLIGSSPSLPLFSRDGRHTLDC